MVEPDPIIRDRQLPCPECSFELYVTHHDLAGYEAEDRGRNLPEPYLIMDGQPQQDLSVRCCLGWAVVSNSNKEKACSLSVEPIFHISPTWWKQAQFLVVPNPGRSVALEKVYHVTLPSATTQGYWCWLIPARRVVLGVLQDDWCRPV